MRSALAATLVLLEGCSLFDGPGDYSHDAATPPEDARPVDGPGGGLGDAFASNDEAGPVDAGSLPDVTCDAGAICPCLAHSCEKETNACLASPGCSCGLACAQACNDVNCYEACFDNAGPAGQDFIGCAAINCATDCF